MLWEQPRFQTVSPPKKIIFYIPLNTCSPTYTNCTGIKHSLTPWCGGEECSSRGLTVAVWELGPVFEVQDTRGNGAVLALLRVGGHRGWNALKTLYHWTRWYCKGSGHSSIWSVWLIWNLAQQSFNNIKNGKDICIVLQTALVSWYSLKRVSVGGGGAEGWGEGYLTTAQTTWLASCDKRHLNNNRNRRCDMQGCQISQGNRFVFYKTSAKDFNFHGTWTSIYGSQVATNK